ncbi:MAG: hypothetical protein LBD17_02415 [Endomicrobium sp.]|jgi:hypothetical protein|nr:hypothetical protein [Endomicrobium sp.]
MSQIHKRYRSEKIEGILGKNERGILKREVVEELLEKKRSCFFELKKKYRREGEGFKIEYKRLWKTREIEGAVEDLIREELK